MTDRVDTARIVVVGAGGLGHALLIELSRQLTRNASIRVLDFDRVEGSNLNRQVCFTEMEIGKPKAEILVSTVTALYPNPHLQCWAEDIRLNSKNISELLFDATIVADASDSPEIKFLLNDFCVMAGIPLCHAAAAGARGQTLLVNPATGGGCLRCIFEAPEQGNQIADTCQQAGILGSFVAAIGFHQAQGIIEALNGSVAPTLTSFVANPLRISSIQVDPNPQCTIKCSGLEIRELDLRAKKCPETFLFTKLALEQIEEHEILEVQFADWQTAGQVQMSLREEVPTALVVSLASSDDPRLRIFSGAADMVAR